MGNHLPIRERKALQRPVSAHGALPCGRDDPREAVRMLAGDGRVDFSLRRLGTAQHPGLIHLVKCPGSHLLLQVCLRIGELGEEHEAGRLAIQPVDGMRRRTQIRAHTALQRIAAARRRGGRVTLQQCGLEDGQQRVILEDDLQGRVV